MQLSLAQSAASAFVDFSNEPSSELKELFGSSLNDERLPPVVSDLLHLWLASGLAHKACHDDVLVYINAVALVYVEFATSGIFIGYTTVPPTPIALVTSNTEEIVEFVTVPEFLLPVSLLPEGFIATASWSDDERRSGVLNFLAHPERYRYGFNTYHWKIEQ